MSEDKEKEPQGHSNVEEDPLAELLFEEEASRNPSPEEKTPKEDEEAPAKGEGEAPPEEEDEKEVPSAEIDEASDESDKDKPAEDSKESVEKVGQEEDDSSEIEDHSEEESEKVEEEPLSQEKVEEEDDPLATILGEDEFPLEGDEELNETEEVPEEPPEEVQEEPPPKKGILSSIIVVLAVLVPLLLFGAGLATFWYLYQNPPFLDSGAESKTQPLTPSQPSPANSEKPQTPLAVSPIAVEDRKILFLRNFLIPYRRETGEFVFVKAKILLYYANSKEYEIAKQHETILREEIYRLFKNAPLYVWETKQGTEVLRREIKEYLTKKKIGGVVPVDLQVTGYILK